MLLVRGTLLLRLSHKWPLSLCSQLHDEVQMVRAFIDVLKCNNVLMLDPKERKKRDMISLCYCIYIAHYTTCFHKWEVTEAEYLVRVYLRV